MFERLESSQPRAKGEATDNGSSISIFFLVRSHRLPIPRLKQKASILHLWLIIDSLARLHTRKIGR